MQSFFRRAPHSPERANHGAASHVSAHLTDESFFFSCMVAALCTRPCPKQRPCLRSSRPHSCRTTARACERGMEGLKQAARCALWPPRLSLWLELVRRTRVDSGCMLVAPCRCLTEAHIVAALGSRWLALISASWQLGLRRCSLALGGCAESPVTAGPRSRPAALLLASGSGKRRTRNRLLAAP